jgi:hypothetical protein
MIARLARKLKFISLQLSVGSYERLTKEAPFNLLGKDLLQQNEKMLRPFYDQYIGEVSQANMAASLELMAFIYTMCSVGKLTRLLDMGSGLSSFVFRLYARQTPGVTVYSVDDDPAWLEKTRDYLLAHDLSTGHMFTLDQFLQTDAADFDCILHDLNFVEVRIKYVEDVMKRVKQGGYVVFDDVHKQNYLFLLLSKLKLFKASVFDLKPVTTDNFGRFALLTMKKN